MFHDGLWTSAAPCSCRESWSSRPSSVRRRPSKRCPRVRRHLRASQRRCIVNVNNRLDSSPSLWRPSPSFHSLHLFSHRGEPFVQWAWTSPTCSSASTSLAESCHNLASSGACAGPCEVWCSWLDCWQVCNLCGSPWSLLLPRSCSGQIWSSCTIEQ